MHGYRSDGSIRVWRVPAAGYDLYDSVAASVRDPIASLPAHQVSLFCLYGLWDGVSFALMGPYADRRH